MRVIESLAHLGVYLESGDIIAAYICWWLSHYMTIGPTNNTHRRVMSCCSVDDSFFCLSCTDFSFYCCQRTSPLDSQFCLLQDCQLTMLFGWVKYNLCRTSGYFPILSIWLFVSYATFWISVIFSFMNTCRIHTRSIWYSMLMRLHRLCKIVSGTMESLFCFCYMGGILTLEISQSLLVLRCTMYFLSVREHTFHFFHALLVFFFFRFYQNNILKWDTYCVIC